MRLATKACELTKWAEPGALDTLAAACAEAGDFNSAVKWQSKAISLAKSSKAQLADASRRLTMYQHRQPYHSSK